MALRSGDARRAPNDRWRRSLAALAALLTVLLTTGACASNGGSPVATPQPTGTASPMSVGAGTLPGVVARVEPSVVTVLVAQGLGSGVVFRAGGLVLTNEHVVRGATTAQLALADGSRVAAEVVAVDAATDLAVLRARQELPPATFRADLPRPGELVLAMGSPLGFRNSVTMGIVSGIGREIPGSATQNRALVDLIQTDAAISPGNSGGALVDAAGRVVGINGAYIPPQAGAVSLGFAIPAPTALAVAEDLLDDGRVEHPYLGIVPAQLTPEIARTLAAPTELGVLVREVVAGGPAARAGLRPGDILTAVDDERIETLEDLLGAVRGTRPGQVVTVTYYWEDTRRTSRLTVGTAGR